MEGKNKFNTYVVSFDFDLNIMTVDDYFRQFYK